MQRLAIEESKPQENVVAKNPMNEKIKLVDNIEEYRLQVRN